MPEAPGGPSTTVSSDPAAVAPAAHRRLERWIDTLEDLVRIPGTRITFGLDVLLGLVPVVGDFAGMVCGVPLVVAAVRRRHPLPVVLVMVANLLVDAVFGVVPVIGNLFDLLWKAHRKNMLLLRRPGDLDVVLREARWKLAALVAIVTLLGAALVCLLVFLVVVLARLRATCW